MTYVAAFRTYTWDEGTRELARRFLRATRTARQVVLADETNNSLGIAEYEVVSHTRDHASLGLLGYPAENPLWFNVDYGVYVLRDALPDYLSAISALPDEPYRLDFADPFVARHVRLTKLGAGVLHLRRVQLFGRSIGPKAS